MTTVEVLDRTRQWLFFPTTALNGVIFNERLCDALRTYQRWLRLGAASRIYVQPIEDVFAYLGAGPRQPAPLHMPAALAQSLFAREFARWPTYGRFETVAAPSSGARGDTAACATSVGAPVRGVFLFYYNGAEFAAAPPVAPPPLLSPVDAGWLPCGILPPLPGTGAWIYQPADVAPTPASEPEAEPLAVLADVATGSFVGESAEGGEIFDDEGVTAA